MAGIGHNNPPSPIEPEFYLGEKFIPLFGPERHKAYFGGRGSAKSHSIATTYPIKMASRTMRVVCARQFQNSIRDSVKELLEQKIRSLGLADQFLFYERELVHKFTESRATFIGLDRNPESAKSLEGADSCWCEEARTINARSMEILIPTIRKPGSEIIWSWNPEHESDPVDDYFRGMHSRRTNPNWLPPPNSIIQKVGIEDNPWFYHTAMPQEMWHMAQGNPTRYRHVWLGEYDESYDTKIFTNIEIGRMDIPSWMVPRYGMDFGFGPDPAVVVKVYINNAAKTIYIAREFFGHHVPLRQLNAALDFMLERKGEKVMADSSAPGNIEHLQSQGYNIQPAKKGPGSVKAGINWLQSYKIIIDPDCENMREEARLYTWQIDRLTRKTLPIPVDAHNHGWDSIRYACEDAMTEGDKPGSNQGAIVIKLGNRN